MPATQDRGQQVVIQFRFNRYNWLGQKLLSQHDYNSVTNLHDQLVEQSRNSLKTSKVSDYLSYARALALMKTTTRLEEVIHALQQLNFDQNNQYFLLLCQCLLYLGNYDSVVALCKQLINREIDSQDAYLDQPQVDEGRVERVHDVLKKDEASNDRYGDKSDSQILIDTTKKVGTNFGQVASEEFLDYISKIRLNNRINEPKLWYLFARSLEFQRQFKDAEFAYQVSISLCSVRVNSNSANLNSNLAQPQHLIFKEPLIRYAELLLDTKHDYKGALNILNPTSDTTTRVPDFTIDAMIALVIASQPNSNKTHLKHVIRMLTDLEVYALSRRNPSLDYNKLALRSKLSIKREEYKDSLGLDTYNELGFGDENRLNLRYLLVRSFVLANSVAEVSSGAGKNEELARRMALQMAELLKKSDSSCWTSGSLWNNLSLYFWVEKRYIACLSCLIKADQLKPLDWRINYNLAMVCLHIGLSTKALACLLTANSVFSGNLSVKSETGRSHPMITTLLAICFDRLRESDTSRQLHIASTIGLPRSSERFKVSALSLVNYLIFLHYQDDSWSMTSGRPMEDPDRKLKLHLLDQLEQLWLQRDQNSESQFSDDVMRVAESISRELYNSKNGSNLATSSDRTYAWQKDFSCLSDLHPVQSSGVSINEEARDV